MRIILGGRVPCQGSKAVVRGSLPDVQKIREVDQAGASTPFHTHPWEHEVYIISGTGIVRTAEKEASFKLGDSVYIAPDEQHCFVADIASALQLICCIPAKDRCQL